MNEYLVFIGNNYYPQGGWEDLSGYFDSLDESIEHIKTFDSDYKWAHVVHEGKIIINAYDKLIDFYKHEWVFDMVKNDLD